VVQRPFARLARALLERKSRAMKNFLRSLRFAWPYRNRLIISLVCALMAALCWSITFTSIDPILRILRHEKSLPEIITAEIKKVETDRIEPLQKQVKELQEWKTKVEQWPESSQRDTELRRIAVHTETKQAKLLTAQRDLSNFHIALKYVEMLLPDNRFQCVAVILALVIGAVAIKGVFEFWQESLVGSVVIKAQYNLRNRFFRRVIHLDLGNFGDTGTHELLSRFTNDVEILSTGMKTLFGKVVAEPLKAICCVGAACFISWRLTLMFLILVPIAFFVLTRIGRTMKRATRRLLERMTSIYKILQESLVGIRVVKAFAREAGERRRFREATRDYSKRAMWFINLDAMSGPIIELLAVIAITLALLAGAYLVIEKQTHLLGIEIVSAPMEPESLLQLYALLASIADPVRKLSSVFTRIQSAYAAADRIFAYMDLQPKMRPNTDGAILARHHHEIEFRNVCFSYTPAVPILAGVSLTVAHGETVAIVGKNGCGKTTLLSLISRFYDPDHGAVLIDGHDIRTANLRSLRRQIGIVTQDTFLFDGTVLMNIAYGRPRASREQIEEAARQAHAHDVILGLPNGYDTPVGEAGHALSGGQRQRIALARAFLLNPSILILDEFTNQADTVAEMEIHRILQEFRQGRTMFVITHRLNTLEIADRIVVLDEGRVAATGTHAELLKSCSLYQRLYEAQSRRMVA
jgi:ATP-binding cassette subfamily B protein/subfamily B ATP-binding cassette protein MsbA